MRDLNHRYTAHQLDYRNHAGEFAAAVETVWSLAVRVAPSAMLFVAFCAAWAIVFGLALR